MGLCNIIICRASLSKELMILIVIKVLIGLFVWWVLPSLLIKKKKSPWKKFTTVACAICGILCLVYAAVDLFNFIFVQ